LEPGEIFKTGTRIYSLEEEPDPELDSWYHLYVEPEPI
jgi:hypothetical protein